MIKAIILVILLCAGLGINLNDPVKYNGKAITPEL
jgi:hypothetical protein